MIEPLSPGIGVTVNWETVEKYRVEPQEKPYPHPGLLLRLDWPSGTNLVNLNAPLPENPIRRSFTVSSATWEKSCTRPVISTVSLCVTSVAGALRTGGEVSMAT